MDKERVIAIVNFKFNVIIDRIFNWGWYILSTYSTNVWEISQVHFTGLFSGTFEEQFGNIVLLPDLNTRGHGGLIGDFTYGLIRTFSAGKFTHG